MGQVTAGGSGGDTLAVDEELVAIVGGDLDGEGFGERRQIETVAEMVDAVCVGIGAGDGDPLGGPCGRLS